MILETRKGIYLMFVLDIILIICIWLLSPPNDKVIVEKITWYFKEISNKEILFKPCVISNIELTIVMLTLKLSFIITIKSENIEIMPNINSNVFIEDIKELVISFPKLSLLILLL